MPSAETGHRAHDSKTTARRPALLLDIGARMLLALAMLFALASSACGGGSLRRPDFVQVRAEDYSPVPFAPRPAQIEIVPPPPRKDAVWIDGSWEWNASRYVWKTGAWVVPPPGARYARWVVVRRAADGQMFFAPASWHNAKGEPIIPPAALLRAKTSDRAPRPGEAEGVTDPSDADGESSDESTQPVQPTPPVKPTPTKK